MQEILQATLVLAQETVPAEGPPPGGGMMTLLFPILLLVGMYFLLIAPQRKRQKEHQKMVTELQKGDDVMTSAGIYGTISNIKDDRLTIRVDENVKFDVNRQFVQTKLPKGE